MTNCLTGVASAPDHCRVDLTVCLLLLGVDKKADKSLSHHFLPGCALRLLTDGVECDCMPDNGTFFPHCINCSLLKRSHSYISDCQAYLCCCAWQQHVMAAIEFV